MSGKTSFAALLPGLIVLLWTPLNAHAQRRSAPGSASDVYLRGYLLMVDGDKLRKANDFIGAYSKYCDARDTFDAVRLADRSWNSEIVDYRCRKIRESIEKVRVQLVESVLGIGEVPVAQSGELPAEKQSESAAAAEDSCYRVVPVPLFSEVRMCTDNPLLPTTNAEKVVSNGEKPAQEPDLAVPAVTATALVGDQFTVRFTTIPGYSYQLESSSDLSGWTSTGTAIRGDGTEKSLSTGVTVTGRQFFRVSRLP